MSPNLRRRIFRICMILFILITLLSCGKKRETTIALFTPRDENDAFWGLVESFMRASCEDLGLNLQVYYAHGSLDKMKEQIQQAASSQQIDALAFHSYQNGGIDFLRIAENTQVPAFLFNSGVDHAVTGAPGEKYQFWIGEMIPDDESAGFGLANLLADFAIKHGKVTADSTVHLIAIEGNTTDGASIERLKGLKRAVAEREDLTLNEIVSGDWKRDQAKALFLELMDQYPETTVIWTASDHMALGVVDGIREKNLIPNKDIFTGGVDWSNDGLWSVAASEMTASCGGHFMEGGWVAVMIYDYLNGTRFSDEEKMQYSGMYPLTKENVRPYFARFYKRDWQDIDFSDYSKVKNPSRATYDFRLKDSL